MSVFQDWGKSFSRPFQQFTGSWKKLLTNPGKMNLGDVFTVAVPGAGALTVNAIKNPWDVAYQAGTAALVFGGAPLLPASAPAGSEALIGSNGYALTARAAPPVLEMSATPGVFGGAGGSSGGFLASLGGAGKAVGGFVTKAAAVSAAARAIATPWQRAINTIKDAVSPPAAPGTSINLSAGGADLGDPAEAGVTQPAQASISNVLMIGLFVSVVGGVLWQTFKAKK